MEKKWYAAYTNPKAEKKVAERLEKEGFDFYLPVVKTLKQWSDRKKWVYEPLFKSYIFLNISRIEFNKVLQTHGLVAIVNHCGKPCPIPENQINAIKLYLKEQDAIVNIEHCYKVGQRVKVCGGPLLGLEGEIIKVQNNNKLRVQIEAINQYINISVPTALTQPAYVKQKMIYV